MLCDIVCFSHCGSMCRTLYAKRSGRTNCHPLYASLATNRIGWLTELQTGAT